MTASSVDDTSDTTETQRTSFIPSQATTLPDSDSVPETVATPAKRPTSLIHKISGLWSTKPDESEQASRKEPAIGDQHPSASILDLSRQDILTTSGTEIKTGENISEEELDIPAFLRRQAN